MEFMEDASTLEQLMIQRAKQRKVPVTGSLELLPLCNMNCDMCYIRLSREEMEKKGRLRTVEEWLELAGQMEQAGVLFLLLTGGEPLLFPGFQRLYRGLKQMGMILTINTNGTLIDEEWADFFGRQKPRRINITLYGANAASYEKLCHYREGFARTLRAVRLLRERGVDVKVSYSATKANKDDMEKVFALGAELNVPVHVDSYMMPAIRERTFPFDEQARLSPEEAAGIGFAALKKQLSREAFRQYVCQTMERIRDPAFPRGDGHVSCLAGNCFFSVNWQGELRPCAMLPEPSVPVFEWGFEKAWKAISDRTKEILLSAACAECYLWPICRTCAAGAVLETGSYQGIPEYLCRYAKEYYRLLLKEKERM